MLCSYLKNLIQKSEVGIATNQKIWGRLFSLLHEHIIYLQTNFQLDFFKYKWILWGHQNVIFDSGKYFTVLYFICYGTLVV